MTDNAEADEIKALSGEGATIEVGGRTVHVRPIKVRQLPAVARGLDPLIKSGIGVLSDDPSEWLALATQGEHLIEAVAAATDQPVEWVGELEPAQFADLLFTVLEVNKDFFSRQINPAIERLIRTMEAIGSTGQQSPSD